MSDKISQKELLPLATVILYGSFATQKLTLACGRYALLFSLVAVICEGLALCIVCILPICRSVVLSLLPVPFSTFVFIKACENIHKSGFEYIPLFLIAAVSAIAVTYTVKKGVARIGSLLALCTAAVLIILVFVYIKDARPSRIAGDYKSAKNALKIILFPLSEVYTIYLFKGFFVKATDGKSAYPPEYENLSAKDKNRFFAKTVFGAFGISSAVTLFITAFLLSLAPGEIYAMSDTPEGFAGRLLSLCNITPLINVFVFVLALFRCSVTFFISAQNIAKVLTLRHK